MLWKMRPLVLALALVSLSHSTGSPMRNSTTPSLSGSEASPPGAASGGLSRDTKPPSSSLTSAWTAGKISNRISQTLEGSFMPVSHVLESSGEGSGFQEGHNELRQGLAPSVSLLEENLIGQELAEKRDNMEDTWFHFAPPSPQRQIQIMDGDGSSAEMSEAQSPHGVSPSTPKHDTAIQSVPSTTSTLAQIRSVSSNWERAAEAVTTVQNEAFLKTATTQPPPPIPHGKDGEDSVATNSAQKGTDLVPKHSENSTAGGATVVTDQEANPQVTSADSSITTNSQFSHLQSSSDAVTQTIQSNQTDEEKLNPEVLPEVPSETPSAGNSEPNPSPPGRAGGSIGPIKEPGFSGPPGPCLLGLGTCVGPWGSNGTALQWEDLSRTLAFAWELHVFGCAVLFLLLVAGSVWGLAGAVGLLRPYSRVLPMANVLLLLAGVLRCAHFLIDPYGTRRILPRPALSALYNLPLPLLLWAQAVLALLVLRGQRLNLLPSALQCPRVTGGLVTLHCSLLLVADILSQALSPALPLMLQTFSVCWGLPLCLGLLFHTLSPELRAIRTPLPQWPAAKRVEDRARRVFSLCTALGALSYALQIHGVLWLYGLLGDWRRFGWGWWLAQFSARLLELTWGYCMLLLSSWVFWRPRGSKRRGEGRAEAGQRGRLGSHWDRFLESLPMGPWVMPDRRWAELIPNNWAARQRAHTDLSGSMSRNYDVVTSVQATMEASGDNVCGGSTSSSVCESYPTSLWSHGHDWSERDCILSLIEFDLCPPSPISLTRSIDNALHYDDLLGVGSLFTPPPPSWTQGLEPYCAQAASATAPSTPTHIAYRWALDAGSSPVQPHCFRGSSHHAQPVEPSAQSPLSTKNVRLHVEDPQQRMEPGVHGGVLVLEDDWGSVGSTDDITDL